MRPAYLVPVLLCLVAAAGAPPATAAGPSLTVYAHDLGLVREERTLSLAGPRDTVRIEDVPAAIDFASVRLSPEGGARVARLAYRWDVASGDALIESALGRRIRVVSRGDRQTEGTLVSADGSWLVVRGADGAVTSLARPAVEAVRLSDPPAGLALRPALEAVVEGARRGSLRARLSYLTGGLSWEAEYTVVRRAETRVEWSGAVTVRNQTGITFADAELQLVAGEPGRAAPGAGPVPMRMAMNVAEASGAKLEQQAFSEYHLYTLPGRATLRDRESQSLTLLEPRAVEVSPRYLYRGGDPRGVVLQLRARNARASGLGEPLPAGRVRFYQADDAGRVQFTGETRIGHTPVDAPLTLDVGAAFDVTAERRATETRRISDRERELSYEIVLRDARDAGVKVTVEEPVAGDFEVVRSSLPATRKDAHTLSFEVPVPARGEARLTYTVRVRY